MPEPNVDWTGVRAVFFDAVGTLIHPEPSAPEVYLAVARRYGSRLDLATIAGRFVAAFRRQEQRDYALGLRTDEAREQLRWREIVAEVLDDVSDPQKCFYELHAHFARAGAWRTTPGTGEVLAALAGGGLRVGIASNFDARLRTVAAGLAELTPASLLVISSEVGWRKPAPEFFREACRQAGFPPDQVVFVGDDPANDYDGARAAGLQAMLVEKEPYAGAPSGLMRLARSLPPA